MKNRKNITVCVLLALLFLFLSQNLFVSFKPGTLSFKYRTVRDAEITVCFARKNSEIFNHKFCRVINVAKGMDTAGVSIDMRRISKVRLNFGDKIKAKDDIKLSDFWFDNGIFRQKVPLKSIIEQNDHNNHYSVTIADVKFYSLVPLFDFKILIILATVYFMFAYKMVKYLAVFKIEQHHSRIDIVFLACFFVLLFIPMSHLSTEESDMKENRMLQKYVPLIKEGKINDDFGKNFEAYFNDRFFGRYYFLKYYEYLKAILSPSEGNINVLIGKNDFLFFRGDNSIKSFQNAELYPDDFLRRVADYLQNINDFCKKNGKLFYFFIAPDKNKIYGENVKYIRKVRPDSESRTFQLIDYLKKHTDVKVIYPYDEMLKAKTDNPDDLLYYKYDTHWNERGGYIGYLALMKEIDKDTVTPKVKIKSWEKYLYDSGDLARMIGSYKKVPATYLKPVIDDHAHCEGMAFPLWECLHCHNLDGQKRILFFHDSFMVNMYRFVAASFRESYFYWRYPNENIDMDNILKNADIIVLENLERRIRIMSEINK